MSQARAMWCHGAARDGRVPVADRGFQLGDGLFDTLVAFNGVAVEGERHLARLLAHAQAIGIALDEGLIRKGWAEALAAAGLEAAILRTTVTRGVAGRGLWPVEPPEPTIVATVSDWSPALAGAPVRLVTSPVRRNEGAPSSRLKSLGYLDNVLAMREARQRGADDALLLNNAGAVASSSMANLFVVDGRDLRTPPLADGVLDGTMRALTLDKAAGAGLRPSEKSLTRLELDRCDGLFVTNSVRFLMPVAALDGRALPEPPESFRRLRAAIAAHVASGCGFDLGWSAP